MRFPATAVLLQLQRRKAVLWQQNPLCSAKINFAVRKPTLRTFVETTIRSFKEKERKRVELKLWHHRSSFKCHYKLDTSFVAAKSKQCCYCKWILSLQNSNGSDPAKTYLQRILSLQKSHWFFKLQGHPCKTPMDSVPAGLQWF